MIARAQPFLAPDHCPDQGTFQEEGEHAFHGQRLPDEITGEFGETRPVCAELKFHRYTGNDTDRKVDAKNARPKARCIAKSFVTGTQVSPFKIYNDPRQSHRELGKEIMIGDSKRELEPAPKKCVFHKVENLDRSAGQSAANQRILPITDDGNHEK